ncbi:NADH-quinone oxidoreductase subunit G [Aestuariimicrobium kwangyangense]|uniref:NADH-quinone oxidoreductase subunit G n=1 Tax=Aestuariimicrobium kwangyangense TaxID=396389 RepID=UPI0003B7061F|nr:NADH-quinone oxidoreductase subunit G [Aestuariimicrobium kwangyangense]
MSVDTKNDTGAKVETKPEEVTLTIDGIEVSVPKGTLVIRAAEKIGVAIPRFCDHPLLDPVGACRQCMVEIPDMGNGRGMPKPQASCTLEAMPGMKVSTQVSSPVAEKAQAGMLEFLLINHPLDCPICDKGGECPLQNQSLANGYGESRYEGLKRTFPKPVNISAEVLLDRERCVLCARCTRFSEQISGDPFIALVERGALQQVGIYEDKPYDSYFSGNVIQICPVGALTSVAYRFQSRPFDLVSTATTCEHCASGCQLRSDHRHFQVKRRLAGNTPEVNEEWNCDKGRFGFMSGRGADRLTTPLVRRNGVLEPAGWHEAIDAAVAGLRAADGRVGVLPGGRLTTEAAYGYSRFARAVLGTNNIDFRSRPYGAGEADFLAAHVAGRTLSDSVTYADLETANTVVLVDFEPEDESPIVFLRLRKAVRKRKLKVVTIAPFRSRGSAKLDATLVATAPGLQAQAVAGLQGLDSGSVILVGERAALSSGTLAAVAELAATSGARLAWIPRRAGDMGAVEAGCLPNLLPGGRGVGDASARVDVAAAWGVQSLPEEVGLDASAMLAAAGEGRLGALVTAGIEPRDFSDPAVMVEALEKVDFLVSIETRLSEVAEHADVVFPVALIEEHAGSFLNWEHRSGRVNTVIRQSTAPMTDLRVLAALADAMGADLGFRGAKGAAESLADLGVWEGARPRFTHEPHVERPASEGLTLATWRQLLDDSAGVDHEPDLQATAPVAVARLSVKTAADLGIAHGETLTVSGPSGALSLPTEIVADMVDQVVWVPANSGTPVTALGVLAGDRVTVTKGAAA